MNQTISYYDEHAEEYCAATVNADMSFCRDRFMTYLPARAHILDAGCGSGRDSKVFLEKGFTVTAIDASEGMCKESEKLLGQDVIQCTFQEMNFQNEFDGIWACASLLHVTRSDIDLVLQNLKKALKYEGVLYLSFKYGNEERMMKERFFNDYNENLLSVVLENNGFTVMDIFTTEDVRKNRSGEMWVNAFAKKLHE
ncbi:MAG: class I SAM-dependent methyltransferase [Lachnospiraceae bacterium]|nr:class I SAM-dependent methyltransferase [Lachnospiraceae bacterium]